MNRILRALFVVIITCVGFAAWAQEAVEQKTEESVESTSAEPTAEATSKPRKETEEATRRDIQDSMTADEFKAAGLDKLSAEELKSLNGWLQGYRQKAETKAAEKATEEVTKKVAKESRTKMDSALSRVDGTFTGLTGRTIIKLEDGSVWRQANADDRFRAQVTDRPPVKVTHTTFGYKMRIVGTGEFYVDPVPVKK
jgi:hypothetical protein